MNGEWGLRRRGTQIINVRFLVLFFSGGSYRMVLDSGGVVHADKIREVDTKIGVDRGFLRVSVSRY